MISKNIKINTNNHLLGYFDLLNQKGYEKATVKNSSSENGNQIILEVLGKNKDGLLINEIFDGSSLFIRWNPKLEKIVNIYGYDEENQYHKPVLLPENDVRENLKKLQQTSKILNFETNFIEDRNVVNLRINKRTIKCKKIIPKISDKIKEKLSQAQIEKYQKETSLYFSEDIPKLLPFIYITLNFINSLDILDKEVGFVKNNEIELIDYHKGD